MGKRRQKRGEKRRVGGSGEEEERRQKRGVEIKRKWGRGRVREKTEE